MRRFIAILSLFFPLSIFAQITDFEKDIIIERTIEFIGEDNEDADIDYTTFIEDFYLLLDNPINLNQASFDDLVRLNLLTDIQIGSIINYRFKYGQLLTIYELGAIEGLDDQTISIILPFVFVGDKVAVKTNWRKVLQNGKHDIILRYQRVLEEKAGYASFPDSVLEQSPNKVYQGNADRYYVRYRYTYGNKLSYGFTGEKDPGETFFRADNAQGFDFNSMHVMVQDVGRFKKIIVGDFHANFGQGLNIWTGFNIGRTVQALKVKQSGRGLRPYTSSNESQFFRGVGITLDFNKFETTVFGSFKRLDARVSGLDTLGSEAIIDNFQLTGFHRTASEIANEGAISQLVFGASTSYQTKKLKINLTALYAEFGGDFTGNSALYNKFNFQGDNQFSLGLDYQYLLPKMSFFGEATAGLNGKISTVNGMLWKIDPKLDLVMVHRYFDRENQNLFGNNFTRRSQNGQGIYVGIETRLTAKMKAAIFYDQSKSEWFRYLVDGPSAERSFLGQLDYAFNRHSRIYIRIRNRLRPRNISMSEASITPQSIQETNSIRFHYSQRINAQFTVKSRIEFVDFKFNDEKSNGILLYQDLIYTMKNIPLKLYGRYAIFDTDDFNSRIFAYENDLLYVFSVPALFNQGFRTYLMAKYEIGRSVDLWLRWSRTSFTDQTTISNGLEQINGPIRSEIKAQIKIRF